MCRFVAYRGPAIRMDTLVTLPINSLIHQSFKAKEREEPLNGDGFGIGWYVPEMSPRPARFRDITPAWNNANLLELARVVSSPCVFAHVRAASPGLPVMQANCHPFVSGSFMFMHNGYVPGFASSRRGMLARLSDEAFAGVCGTTDSEALFATFLDAHARSEGDDPLERMGDALEATIRLTLEASDEAGNDAIHQLNLCVSDGERLAVTRFASGPDPELANSLYVHTGRRYVYEDGVCQMLEADETEAAVLVASERLSEDPGWDRIPGAHAILASGDGSARLRPLRI